MSPSTRATSATSAAASAQRGLVVGAAIGCMAGVIISAYNPHFVDSIWLGLLVLWASPAVAGAVLWLVGSGLVGVLTASRRSDQPASPGAGPAPRSARQRYVVLLLLAVIVIGLRVAAHLSERPLAAEGGSPHAFILGLDGATWDIMDPMMARGELPNLAALRGRGASGVLTSIEPTLSPAVWTTIATGKLREKHGVKGFTYTQEDLRSPRIWELLEGEGKTIGMMSWLVTWPPAVRRGFMVPGWLARTSETYPPELHFAQDLILGEGLARSPREYLAYIIDAPRLGVRLSTLTEALRLVAYSKLRHPPLLDLVYRKDLLKATVHADIFCWLLRRHRPDFSAAVFYGTDSLGHVYWKYMEALSSGDDSTVEGGSAEPGAVTPEEAERYGTVLYRYYMLMDSLLPRFLAALPADVTVCVVSDHGHGPREGEWEYLVLKSSTLIQTLGLAETVTVASVGDFSFVSPAPGRGPEALEEAARALSSLTVTGKHTAFLEIEMTGTTSLSLRVAEGVDLADTLSTAQGGRLLVADYVEETGLSGTHTLSGVVILAGKGVKQGYHIQNASLVDVTPTLLHLMHSTIGEDMDGRVLTECLEDPFLAANPVETVETRDGEVALPWPVSGEDMPEAVRKRLRELGYVK